MKVGIVVNDIYSQQALYTTPHMAMVAANRGHEIWYMGVADLGYGPDENTHAMARPLSRRHYADTKRLIAGLHRAEARRLGLEDLDVLMLRQDPAEDFAMRPWARLSAINFGRLAMRHGVLVVNDPNGLSAAVNKMYLEYFPREVRPRAMISRDRATIREFIDSENGYAVLKPLFGSGGHNVFLVTPEERNINQMIETVCNVGYTLVQEYLPDAVNGDTRLFLLNGKPFTVGGKYAALRRARPGDDDDIRSNLSRGAVPVKAEIDERMLALAERVGPKLVEDGMFLAGLDIVGDKLMEINVFCPAGLTGACALEGEDFYTPVIEALERKVEHIRHLDQPFENAAIAAGECGQASPAAPPLG